MAPNPPRRMGRPNDVPSWGECTRRAWKWIRWVLSIVPLSSIMGLTIVHYAYKAPTTPIEAVNIQAMKEMALYGMPLVALFMWTIIFLSAIQQERWAKTPKEVEEQERNRLAYLKNKYPD